MKMRRPRSARSAALIAGIVCAAGVTLTVAGDAHAQGHIIDLRGELLMSVTTGRGTDKAAPDFFHQTQGLGFGVELGVRLLVLDFSVRFVQMVGTDGRAGTLTLLPMFGPSLEIPLQGGGTDLLGKRRPPKLVLRPALAAGFGFGTPSPGEAPVAASVTAITRHLSGVR